MSFPQFGYLPSVPTSLSTSQLLMSAGSMTANASGVGSSSSPCCETGRPIMTDPQTGQTICSCQYPGGALLTYPRVPGLADSVYNSAYATQGLMSLGAEVSAFYPPMGSLSQSTPCYPYDPTLGPYGYANGFAMDPSRRKNATRESTQTLKAWLSEHKKNPYPTKGEKIMLAIITKMTLTQVSTWFANARRRLKKDNKMTWSPKTRCEDDEKMDSDDEGMEDSGELRESLDGDSQADSEIIDVDSEHKSDDTGLKERLALEIALRDEKDRLKEKAENHLSQHRFSLDSSSSVHSISLSPRDVSPLEAKPAPVSPGEGRTASPTTEDDDSKSDTSATDQLIHPVSQSSLTNSQNAKSLQSKPKIWSLADVATSSDSSSHTQQGRQSPQGFARTPLRAHTGMPHASFTPTTNTVWSARAGLAQRYSMGPHLLASQASGVGGIGPTPVPSPGVLPRFTLNYPLSVASTFAASARLTKTTTDNLQSIPAATDLRMSRS